MERQEALEALAEARNGAISVTIMQSSAPWKDAGQTEKDHIDVVGCMGGASSLGLGLALGAPHRKVMVLDGDGSLLMQLGSLVTVAGAGPTNYYHFVFDNGVHQSSGNQPVPGHGKFDWCRLALSAGYRAAHSFDDRQELRAALPRIMRSDGPVLIRLGIARDDGPTRWPGVAMSHYVRTLKESLAAAARP